MDTISNKIVRLYSATSAIRDAILSKGGTVLTSDGLEAFPQAITTIPTGGGDGIEVVNEDVEMLKSMINRSYQESTVSFDVYKLRDFAFMDNSGIVEAIFPYCLETGNYAFASCSSLQSVSFPVCTTIGSKTFQGCTSLQSVSFPNCTSIDDQAFCSCTSLRSVYLLSTSVCTLSNSTAFRDTPLSNSTYLGYYGSIYVPRSLLTSYKKATNWTYYSSRFVGV